MYKTYSSYLVNKNYIGVIDRYQLGAVIQIEHIIIYIDYRGRSKK